MPTPNPDPSNHELSLTSSDIYLAAEQGVLLQDDAERLVRWGYEQRFNRSGLPEPKATTVEQRKGLNLVTVAYYFGALLMISACAWFLGDKWKLLGSPGILATVILYMMIAGGVGWWIRNEGYIVGGGLLITVVVCLVPLLTYSIEDILHLWPSTYPGHYEEYYSWIHGSWIVMELATIAAGLIALRFVRFGFLTAPIAFSFWFLSMDLTGLILKTPDLSWEAREWVSVAVGLCTLLVGYAFQEKLHKPGAPRSEDFAFWFYLFGLLAFWGGLTAMNSGSELMRVWYALLNVALMWLAVKLRRATFLVFGALGIYSYLGHLAYQVFSDSFFFPFVLALLGLSMILLTVWFQRRVLARVNA